MATAKRNARKRLSEWLAERQPAAVDERHWEELKALLQPIGDRRLRQLLRDSGHALTPVVEGVRQDSFEHLERTLLALEKEYGCAASSPQRRRLLRRLVISAKDHARLASRSARTSEEKRTIKREMALWMLTWLENPAVFPAWVRQRSVYLSSTEATFKTPS